MGTSALRLAEPPTEVGSRELWLQHGAGLILFEDVRDYACKRLDPELGEDARSAALEAIDDAVYGLMMVLDGVSGILRNERLQIRLRTSVLLEGRPDDADPIAELDFQHGDGMCIGYHGWLEGDFGEAPLAIVRPRSA